MKYVTCFFDLHSILYGIYIGFIYCPIWHLHSILYGISMGSYMGFQCQPILDFHCIIYVISMAFHMWFPLHPIWHSITSYVASYIGFPWQTIKIIFYHSRWLWVSSSVTRWQHMVFFLPNVVRAWPVGFIYRAANHVYFAKWNIE